MARVFIIGGHGKVALEAAPRLTRDGHQVTSLFRRPEQENEVAASGATPHLGDVQNMSTDELAAAMAGADVVIWSAGAGGGDPERTYAIDRDAAVRSIDAAQKAGVTRYVMVSYLGAGLDHGVPEDSSFYPYAQSKAEADAHLRASSLAWTLVMPGLLTSEPSPGGITLNPTEGDHETSRALVAEVITAVVNAPEQTVARVEIPFENGETPVTDAIDRLAGAR